MSIYILDSINIILAGIFVLLNGFFVAAEFAIVKVRASRLEELRQQHKPFDLNKIARKPLYFPESILLR
jgi:CBS domain containing-hemolysin-like protein